MKPILTIVSFFGLGLTIVPSLLAFNGTITKQTHFELMTIGLVMWFAAAPFWMKSKPLDEKEG